MEPTDPRPTVLLAEDDAAVRTVLGRALELAGWRVVQAHDGVDALAVAPARIDLVVADLVMPRMGGRELVDRLRRGGRRLPALLISGYGGTPFGPDERFLAKPFRPTELARQAQLLLAGS